MNGNLFTTQQKAFQRSEVERVNTELARWRRGSPRARTIMIVSMKQHQHLDNLARLLGESDFSDVPTLIIDDEGDQAGMNTKAKQDDESTTYARIKALRALFPHHSYILYTATPQAPLLISRIDALSPDFGRVLTPGTHYVGGQEFFVDGADKYVKLIPLSEVPDKNDPPHEAPESLRAALRDFFIGVAIGLLEDEFQKGRNRSMMIHPAVAKDEHLMFKRWTQQIKDHWSSILQDSTHPDYAGLLSDFRKSAGGIFETYDTSLTFEDIAPILFEAMEETAVAELNTREKSRIAPVDWAGEYSWILIGGIGLDRGFTVEGLTVSYMPRSTGVGNADNIQQRARFFGYKKRYLGLCRIYLTSANTDAFTDYVKHEESVSRLYPQSSRRRREPKRLASHLLPGSEAETHSVPRSSCWRCISPKVKAAGSSPIIPSTTARRSLKTENLWNGFSALSTLRPTRKMAGTANRLFPAFSDALALADILPMIGQLRYRWPDDNLRHSALMLGLERMVSGDAGMTCSFYALSGPWSGVDYKRTLTEKITAQSQATLARCKRTDQLSRRAGIGVWRDRDLPTSSL